MATGFVWPAVECFGLNVGNLCKCRLEFPTACTFGSGGEVFLRHERRHFLSNGGCDQPVDRNPLTLSELAELLMKRFR